ncbi:replicative DNA helicase [candidate division WWE3 bacterium RBG_13_37_7]|uniref:Replicative DNA helicase n=1 Tax=candidate division WWE3 bacterium RBG_13_37_7 TaxID=1802609 RepID=A0A1F4U346_UNCKA|nr:MAG: replicative DNA helicase [candidate division WWE3 bacterium RBG_13_37_7]
MATRKLQTNYAQLQVPPHDVEAEKSVLGALLLDKDAIVKVVDFLHPRHFYKDVHAKIYEAILRLFEAHEPADLITAQSELKKMKALKEVGGVSYLTELVNFVPTAANVETYAHIIKDAAIKRFVLSASAEIGELAFSDEDVSTLLDKSEQLLYSISQDSVHQDFVPIKDILEVTFERLDELSKNKGELRGVPTGLRTLDRLLSGMREGNLVVLAARPSVGKSALAFNIAQHAALNKNRSIVIFSLEMNREMIVDRMISAQAGIDNWKISTGNLSPEDFEKYGIAAGELAEAPIFIDDTPAINILEMRTKSRRLMLETKIDLIIVDYLQLMRGNTREGRVQEVTELSQGLKALARELNVPVLAVSQLSRAVEQRGGDKKPQLSDLRDSGSIEQDADVVMFLWRTNEDDKNNHKLLLAKHRNGPTGEIELYFKPEITQFFEVEADKS